MRKLLLISGIVSGALAPAVASAATMISFTPNNYAVPAYANATTVQNFESAPDAGSPYAPGPRESVTGEARVFSVTWPGTAVDPDQADGNHYLSIVNGSYTVALATPVQFFSFVLGSLDSYNTLTLGFTDNTTRTFSGRQIIGDSTPGPFNSSVTGRVSFDQGGGAGITSARFASNQASFEIDDLVSAVPEPGTWGMMLLGVGAAGAVLRRRRTATARLRFA